MTARSDGGQRGFVLIIALVALTVMTLLLVALMHGATHQMRGAESAAVLAREKMLSDSAVALVIGQIAQASTQPGLAWISQPGLLRTYDATATRQPVTSYKLYSTADLASLVDHSGNLDFLATDVPADWDSVANQNLYTDLNLPQKAPGFFGTSIYPILDPAALISIQGVSTDAPHQVEMPVRWLYELQDGTLGPASLATAANPIVGRMAFWTDDDTCKIDINTAGVGSPWNTPRVNSPDDVTWSTTPPALGEFPRYPGHPAMTSLVPVFGQGELPPSASELLGLTPRYADGGSSFGTQPTTPGETVPLKMDRLYASVNELAFGATAIDGRRQPQSVATAQAAQVDQARFVLTAHSESPETTLLGEPRFAIWPVAAAAQDDTLTTATDRAVASAATVGSRSYFFQRSNPLSSTTELDPATPGGPSNAQLFSDLLARGALKLPGYGTAFTQKYPGAKWTQLMLEIVDFMRGLNAVDPSPAPFVPYAPGNADGVGRGFIVPLTATDPATGTAVRGLGRCPTLASLTLVLYVCGFGFDDGSVLDFDATPDDDTGSQWQANFDLRLPTNRWPHVTSELIRAFVVPATFHPGCGFPEVSDACDLQISGLDQIKVSAGSASGDFGFTAGAYSPILGTPFKALAPDRAWGGNDGPVAWRLAQDAVKNGGAAAYTFAGGKAFALPMASPSYDKVSKTLNWNQLPFPVLHSIAITGASNLTVQIRDTSGKTIQTIALGLPDVTVPAPSIQDEGDQSEGAAAPGSVRPSYYMCLKNRLRAAQQFRPLMIQPGDATRAVEVGTDLRVAAALATVPASFGQMLPNYTGQSAQVHNFRFSDGVSAYGAAGANGLVALAPYPVTPAPAITGTDWSTGVAGQTLPGSWLTTPACSAPTVKSSAVTMTTGPGQSAAGDWDTGPGFEPDGALIGLPDAGTSLSGNTAYFSLTGSKIGAPTRFAPNALVPSPVIFGSLPAGIDPATPAQSNPWRTLLFCPYPAADTAHPGFATPPDHLVLDNFWMPVVEPYAFSTCLATAGKINLNDQIVPFTYLHRSTALHALLHDLRIPAIPLNMANPYKTAGTAIATIWNAVDEDATIGEIESRFTTGDAYLTESEICTVPLVPLGEKVADLEKFWTGPRGSGRLTGDNLRELPYAQLYGRLTTRSNSYTVHVRVQVLQKLRNDPQQNVWKEGTDLVLGDWRGSYEIERYLDPTAKAPDPGKPLKPYLFRIVSLSRFAP